MSPGGCWSSPMSRLSSSGWRPWPSWRTTWGQWDGSSALSRSLSWLNDQSETNLVLTDQSEPSIIKTVLSQYYTNWPIKGRGAWGRVPGAGALPLRDDQQTQHREPEGPGRRHQAAHHGGADEGDSAQIGDTRVLLFLRSLTQTNIWRHLYLFT